jgi:hypothetical protein
MPTCLELDEVAKSGVQHRPQISLSTLGASILTDRTLVQ